MTGIDVAPVVPNATQLQTLLQPTRYGSKTVADHGVRMPADRTNVGRRLAR